MSADDLAEIIWRVGHRALLAKLDIKSAYLIVSVHPEDHQFLGMQWTALPFGLWPAPQSCSMHLQMHWNGSCELGVAACSTLLRLLYHSGVSRIRQVYSQPLLSTVNIWRVGCPSTCLPFLGIEVDTMAMETWPPLDKFQYLKLLVAEWHHCKSCWERNWDL